MLVIGIDPGLTTTGFGVVRTGAGSPDVRAAGVIRTEAGLPTSTRLAAHRAGVAADKVDLAELHGPFTTSEHLLIDALGLDEDSTAVNPSGGALAANTMMASGLIRIGEAASRIWRGDGDRAVAHATSGPCLQQNMVCVLEGD